MQYNETPLHVQCHVIITLGKTNLKAIQLLQLSSSDSCLQK